MDELQRAGPLAGVRAVISARRRTGCSSGWAIQWPFPRRAARVGAPVEGAAGRPTIASLAGPRVAVVAGSVIANGNPRPVAGTKGPDARCDRGYGCRAQAQQAHPVTRSSPARTASLTRRVSLGPGRTRAGTRSVRVATAVGSVAVAFRPPSAANPGPGGPRWTGAWASAPPSPPRSAIAAPAPVGGGSGLVTRAESSRSLAASRPRTGALGQILAGHHAERVDIGGGGDRTPVDLLRGPGGGGP
jgi:hypothetical protein